MKISLITVSFNSSATIKDTFDSVLAQTYPNIEYIVVDGKSSDNTVEIIKEYESRFNGRMHWLSQPDKGLYDAINKGIKMATGDIVGVIHSDDFYNLNSIIEQVVNTFLRKKEIEVIYGDLHFVKSENLTKTVRYYSSKRFNPKQFKRGFMPAHPTFFTYKNNFEKIGYYKTNYTIAADFELLLRFLFVHKLSYQYLPLNMITMRMGGLSTRSYKSNILLNKEIIRACRENGVYTNFLFVYSKYFRKIFEFLNYT